MTVSDEITELGDDFWTWRAAASFASGDDIPRLPRPRGYVPEVTPDSIERRREALAAFADRWSAVDVGDLPVADQVDHRLLGSALARTHWELDVTRNWEKDAVFLTSQILGPWFDLLLPPPPFDADRSADLVTALGSVPGQVDAAIANLDRAGVATLARVAAEMLEGIGARLAASVAALTPHLDAETGAALAEAQGPASEAVDRYLAWLTGNADRLGDDEVVGRERFVWYLRHVALLPDEPEDLVRAALQDYRRAYVAELLTRNKHRDVAEAPLATGIAAQVENQAELEQQIRDFYEREGILTQPDELRHYLIGPVPDYVEPLKFLAVNDDLTDENRLDVDGVSYAPDPAATLPYFYAANARDPRLGVIHEGTHYQQLALAAAGENRIRRRYYDSVANEGIAFYNEEMMLIAGLFDDAPHSQEIVHNFNRLRSLRVVVDVNLATGIFTLGEGVQFFVDKVPMDRETALDETAMYVATPGLAMSYHVGKQQVLRLLTDAAIAGGDAFSLRDFHDFVWRNGNVPFSLQRWELLGDRSDVDALDAAGSWRG